MMSFLPLPAAPYATIGNSVRYRGLSTPHLLFSVCWSSSCMLLLWLCTFSTVRACHDNRGYYLSNILRDQILLCLQQQHCFVTSFQLSSSPTSITTTSRYTLQQGLQASAAGYRAHELRIVLVLDTFQKLELSSDISRCIAARSNWERGEPSGGATSLWCQGATDLAGQVPSVQLESDD
ncbi:hypothetical protein VFPPC_17600 [Pochonia chlamydosporia 170]|uniref:Uncharacterized protein n=1 Tax=Pochonia chlamydosporia 170 TaxID=1380566 RepID=A0A219AR24_METCM|nr:hypothetical protein VFPPC_17600 [Pochonia chlamydosporia 170]OWT43237.1 hypothetical protein VFPPC_17600 [Pochonia chlamydosporia 170]